MHRPDPVTNRMRVPAGLAALLFAAVLTASWPAATNALSLGGLKNNLVEFLLEKVSVPGQFELSADQVDAQSDGLTTLRGVKIADARGIWFQAERFELGWSAARLLRGEVQIDVLSITGGRLQRLPELPPAPAGEQTAEDTKEASAPLEWPRSPITLRVVKLALTDMRISERVLPQPIAFDAQGALTDEGDTQALRLDVARTDAVAGQIGIDYEKRFDNDALRLDLNASEAANGLVAALAGLPPDAPARLELKGNGDPADWKGDLTLALERRLDATGSLQARWQDRIGAVMELLVRPGERLDPALSAVLGDEATLAFAAEEGDNGLIRIERAALNSASLQGQAEGSFHRETTVVDLSLSIEAQRDGARRLSRLMRPLAFTEGRFTLQASGPVDALELTGDGEVVRPVVNDLGAARATGQFNVALAPGRTSKLAFSLDQPFGPTPSHAEVLGPALQLNADLLRTEQGIRLESFEAGNAEFDFDASGVAAFEPATSLDLEYRLRIPRLDRWSEIAGLPLRGAADAKGTVKGPADDLVSAGAVDLAAFFVRGHAFGDVALTHDTRIAQAISGGMQLRMTSPSFGPGAASSRFSAENGGFELRELDADLLGIKLRGTLALAPGEQIPDADLALAIQTLEPVGALLGQPLTGSGDAALKVDRRIGGTANLLAEFSGVRWQQHELESMTVSSTTSGLSQRWRTETELAASNYRGEAATMTRLQAALTGPADALGFTLSGTGEVQSLPARIESAGTADAFSKRQVIALDVFDLQWAGEPLRLRAPSSVAIEGEVIEVAPLALQVGDTGQLQLEGSFSQATLVAKATARGLPLRLAKVWFDAPVEAGELDLDLAADTAAALKLQLQAGLRGLRVENEVEQVPAFSANLEGQWRESAPLAVQAELAADGVEQPIRVDAEVPLLSLQAAPWAQLDENGALAGRVTWLGPVEAFVALAPLPDHRLEGRLNVDVTLAGTPAAPKVLGQVRLQEGTYEHLVAGLLLRDLEVDAGFTKDGAINLAVDATDGANGTLNLAANTQVDDPLGRLDATLTARELLAVRLDAAKALISADIEADGKIGGAQAPAGLHIAGQTTVDRAEIRLLNPAPASVADLGPVEFEEDPRPATEPEEQAAKSNTTLDLRISMPGQIFVRGRGLDSEYEGELTVTGDAAKPAIEGAIVLRRGTLDLIGRLFRQTRGRINFQPGEKIDPIVDIEFQREAADITGLVIVDGRASKPRLRFSSKPAVPDEEVLPRVLFGRSKQSLSASEAVQLASGIATLASGEAGVLDRARETLGVDVLRFESDPSGESASGSLSVGRYVTEDVYLGARQSLDGRAASIVVEYEWFRNILVDGDFGQDGEASAGINWRKDF